MIFEHQSKNRILLLAFSLIILALGALYLTWAKFKPAEPVFCTQEAKVCPDGSFVSRTGPNCEFAVCPENSIQPGQNNEGWKTFSDEERGISFQYPDQLTAKYIKAFDWPPQIQVFDSPFSCVEVGAETEQAGKTEKRMVDNRDYCVTAKVEGAAGSSYTQYAYATELEGKIVIFSFSLRAPQCANYGDPEKIECEGERETFDLDSVVNRMAESVLLSLN